mgnify:FL=1
MNPPRSALGAPDPGAAANGPAEPDPPRSPEKAPVRAFEVVVGLLPRGPQLGALALVLALLPLTFANAYFYEVAILVALYATFW